VLDPPLKIGVNMVLTHVHPDLFYWGKRISPLS